jgi:hypothetical protein
MSEKRAGGILASSFVAGLLLAAAIFSPRAWDPVPGPYFGLEDQTTAKFHSANGMEAAHAELSARAQARMSAGAFAPVAALVADPVAAPLDTPPAVPAAAVAPTDTGLMPTDAEPVVLDVAPAVIPSVVLPPQRIAMADTASPAATAALADTLPPPTPAPATPPVPVAAPLQSTLPAPQVVVSSPAPIAVQPSEEVEPPASLKAMMTRMQAAQPPVSQPPQQIAEQTPKPVPSV